MLKLRKWGVAVDVPPRSVEVLWTIPPGRDAERT
jgi:hypothetical protein